MIVFLAWACAPAGPPDPGLVEIAPTDAVEAGAPMQWVVTYTLGMKAVAGAQVRVLFPHPYHNNRPANLRPQVSNPQQPGYCALTIDEQNVPLALSETALYPQHLIATAPEGGWAKGTKLIFTLGGEGEAAFRAPYAADEEFAPFVVADLDADGVYEKPTHQGAAKITPGPAVKAVLYAPAQVNHGAEFAVTLTFLDQYGNPTDNLDLDTIKITAPLETMAEEVTVQQPATQGGFIRLDGLKLIPRAEAVRLTAEVGGAIGSVVSNPIRILGVTEKPRQVFFGDPHGHSVISDGARDPAAWYDTALGPAALDFAALTDHEWQIDPVEWERMREQCRQRSSRTFTTLLGWEYSLGGHGIVYYPTCEGAPTIGSGGTRDLWQVVLGGGRPASWQLTPDGFRFDVGTKPILWEQVRQAGALYIAHTTATTDMGDEADLDDPAVVQTVEVYSSHGSNFGPDDPDRVPNFAPSGTVLDMLSRGRRFSLVAASDTHDSRPGLATWGNYPSGLTAVLAFDNSRAAIFQALRDGRTYATTGHRSLIDFTVNYQLPGSRLADDRVVRVHWRVFGDGPIKTVEIWRNGKIWISQELNGTLTAFGSAEDKTHRGPTWYLLRLTLADGGQAWTSPIFVDDPRTLVIEQFVARDAGGETEVVVRAQPGPQTQAVVLWRRHGDDGGPERAGYEMVGELDLAAGPVNFRDPGPAAPGLTTYYLLEESTSDGVIRHGPIALVRFPEFEFIDGEFRFPAYVHGAYPAQAEIRDIDGRLVRRIDAPADSRGLITLTWNGRDEQGQPVNKLCHYRVKQGPYATRWRPLIPPEGSR
ncbi:MAG: DUF3604 domain-containing protein [Alphaproteobacteria bacterium]